MVLGLNEDEKEAEHTQMKDNNFYIKPDIPFKSMKIEAYGNERKQPVFEIIGIVCLKISDRHDMLKKRIITKRRVYHVGSSKFSKNSGRGSAAFHQNRGI
jgi:hypothetical protein